MNLNDSFVIAMALDGYKISDQKANSVDSTIIYDGFLNKDSRWYIIEQNTTLGTYRYLKGSSGYSTAWSGREANAYAYFDTTFNTSN